MRPTKKRRNEPGLGFDFWSCLIAQGSRKAKRVAGNPRNICVVCYLPSLNRSFESENCESEGFLTIVSPRWGLQVEMIVQQAVPL